ALRRRLAAPILAREEPVGEWEVRQQPDGEVLTRRYDALLDAAFEQRVVVLGADESREAIGSRDPVGIGDLPGVEVRRADVANLAFGDELVQRGERFFHRRLAVREVQLVEIDPISAQALEG